MEHFWRRQALYVSSGLEGRSRASGRIIYVHTRVSCSTGRPENGKEVVKGSMSVGHDSRGEGRGTHRERRGPTLRLPVHSAAPFLLGGLLRSNVPSKSGWVPGHLLRKPFGCLRSCL